MMSKRQHDPLFQLIRALEKAEKRHFKLYIKRNSSNEDLKIVRLFDALDKMPEYDEARLLKKLAGIEKAQLSNLKSHLYKEIMASLRLLKRGDSLDLQLNEQFDYAHILYKKGLFHQSLKILERAKEVARANQKLTFLVQAISLEKRIESLHITGSLQDRAEVLSHEALEVSRHIEVVARLSNLTIQLFSWYTRHGFVRNADDEKDIRQFMKAALPHDAWSETGFYERLYLYQSYSWFAYIRQDFLMYYRYTRKWVDLFEENTLMKRVETGHYLKGLHYLLNAHFDLRNHIGFAAALQQLEEYAQSERVQHNENFRTHSFFYIAQARINQHFLKGTFTEALALVPGIEERIEQDALFIDNHRVMVLNYKIACLYFGAGDYDTCIDYLNKIINDNTDLRYDLQCYARLLHMLAHYELGNDELMEHLSRSVYRFMKKMKNLTQLEEEMLRFLRRPFYASQKERKQEMEAFLKKIKGFEKNRFQTRVFVYLDIITWVESKVYNKPLPTLMREKYNRDVQRLQKGKEGVRA